MKNNLQIKFNIKVLIQIKLIITNIKKGKKVKKLKEKKIQQINMKFQHIH